VFALGVVLVIQCMFALCLISAIQLLSPHEMPFGEVGSSPVVSAVVAKEPGALNVIAYPSKSAALQAIDQARIYGAYITGSTSDTVIVAGAKSFFGQIDLQAAFTVAAHKLHRPVTAQDAKPLPPYDPTGAVVGLLLLPLLIGGFLASVLVFKAAGGVVARRWRVSILAGYALAGAVLVDLIAGPWLGAYPTSHFWPLLPCFWLVTATIAVAASAIQGLAGRLGAALVVIVFIVVGGASAGGAGTYMLPNYWRNIGVVLPPQNAVTLFRNVIYFGGNDITVPLIVLGIWAAAGVLVLVYLEWIVPARAAAAARARGEQPAATSAASPRWAQASPPGAQNAKAILVALLICAFMECLYGLNYMSSGHQPVATNLPFGTTGSSPLLTAAQKSMSLQVSHYPNESAVKDAIGQAKLYGALIPSTTAGTPSTLLVANSMSDLAPLPLAAHFEAAAKATGMPLKVQAYQPVPLAPKDPYALVIALMMVPLLIGGYVSANMLRQATGTASGRWRGVILAGYAIVAGLFIALIAGPWLQGFPLSSFWLVWPILALIIATVAMFAAVLQRLLGAAGTLLTMIVIICFGNPSSGGANGVPFLNGFWGPLGPFLPPRNAYLLLRNTVYFHGHNITQPLIVLLAYGLVAAAILGVFDWERTSRLPVTPETETEAAAMAVPIGAAP
jgi:hypothetical protein